MDKFQTVKEAVSLCLSLYAIYRVWEDHRDIRERMYRGSSISDLVSDQSNGDVPATRDEAVASIATPYGASDYASDGAFGI